MTLGRSIRASTAVLLLMSGLAVAARAPRPVALAAIEPGEWQLTETDADGPPRLLCVADPRALLQLHHDGAQCSRFLIDDQRNVTTVRYTCPGAGYGRTTITVETPRLLHIETQGIAAAAPFDHDYQARRLGACR